MKKFAFLLALVAVFAMSATAFAAGTASITAIGTGKAVTGQNNGVLTVNELVASTDVYYVGAIADNTKQLTVAVSLDVDAMKTAGDKLEALLKGDEVASRLIEITAGTAQASKTWDTDNAVVFDGAKFTTKNEAIAKAGAEYTIGAAPTAGTSWVEGAAQAKLNVIPVEVKVVKSLDVIKASSNDEQTVSLVLPDGALVVPGKDKLELKGDAPAGVKYAIKYDEKTKLTTIVVSTDEKIAADGKLEFQNVSASFAATDVVISDDKVGGIAIKGLAANTVLVEIPLIAKENPADDIYNAVSTDVNLKKDAINVIVDGKVVSSDAKITVSDDLPEVTIQIISLDKDGKTLYIPADSKATLAAGLEHKADEKSVDVEAVVKGNKALEITVGPDDIAALNDAIAEKSIAAIVPIEGEYHVDALGVTRGINYQGKEEVEDSKSSSGACSMGFGLAAIAGLAALVLKKRG